MSNQPNPNDDYYEEIDENFYSNKSQHSVVYAEMSDPTVSKKKSNLKQSTRNSLKYRNDARLTKLRTVPMRYENTNYFHIDPGEPVSKKLDNKKEPSDSLNNLDLSMDPESIVVALKPEYKVTKKIPNFEDNVSGLYYDSFTKI